MHLLYELAHPLSLHRQGRSSGARPHWVSKDQAFRLQGLWRGRPLTRGDLTYGDKTPTWSVPRLRVCDEGTYGVSQSRRETDVGTACFFNRLACLTDFQGLAGGATKEGSVECKSSNGEGREDVPRRPTETQARSKVRSSYPNVVY